MEQANAYEQEVDLKDLLYVIVKRWRGVLLAALAVGVLAGAYRVLTQEAADTEIETETGVETFAELQETYEEELAAYETRLATAELQYERANALLEKELAKLERLSEDDQTAQISSMMNINVLRESIDMAKEDMDTLKDRKPEAPSAESRSGFLKYAAVGFVLGGFVSVFLICAAYLMSDKPRGLRELSQRFGVKELGEFSALEKKRFAAGVDALIDRIFGIRPQCAEAEVYGMIAANAKNYLPEGAAKLLVTGGADLTNMERLQEVLRKALPELSVTAAAELTANPEAAAALSSCDAVILAEQKKKSSNTVIEAEMQMIGNVGKTVVGAVLFA